MTTDHLARRRWKWKRKEAGHENPVDDDANYISKNLFVKDRQGQNGKSKDQNCNQSFCIRGCLVLSSWLSCPAMSSLWMRMNLCLRIVFELQLRFPGEIIQNANDKAKEEQERIPASPDSDSGQSFVTLALSRVLEGNRRFFFCQGCVLLASFLVLVRWQMRVELEWVVCRVKESTEIFIQVDVSLRQSAFKWNCPRLLSSFSFHFLLVLNLVKDWEPDIKKKTNILRYSL